MSGGASSSIHCQCRQLQRRRRLRSWLRIRISSSTRRAKWSSRSIVLFRLIEHILLNLSRELGQAPKVCARRDGFGLDRSPVLFGFLGADLLGKRENQLKRENVRLLVGQ